jgi:hypothetical protein
MASRWHQTGGLRPTLRQLLILVLFFALVSAVMVPPLKSGSYLIASFVLPFTLPILAVLILLFDRRGPIKFWLVGLLASLFLPAVVVWVDAMVAIALGPQITQWSVSSAQGIVILVILNSLGISVLFRVRRYWPRRCPECRSRALLPLGRVQWCAACGFRLMPAR